MVERYYQELLNFLSRLVRDRDAAADLVQESYARLAALQRGGTVIDQPRALLYRTARNLVIDRHRRAAVRAEFAPEGRGEGGVPGAGALLPIEAAPAPAACEPEAVLAARQQARALLDTIAALPLRCREAFILHRFDGLTQAEVAERMGISVKMVERHIKLALQACQDCRRQLDGAKDRRT